MKRVYRLDAVDAPPAMPVSKLPAAQERGGHAIFLIYLIYMGFAWYCILNSRTK